MQIFYSICVSVKGTLDFNKTFYKNQPMYNIKTVRIFQFSLVVLFSMAFGSITKEMWQSKYIKVEHDNKITYTPDENGNTIPDFSHVGYQGGDKPIPKIAEVKTISPTGSEDDQALIQSAIDEVSKRAPDPDGFRGAVLLRKGVYKISGSLNILASGIVLRGEGNGATATKLISTAKKQVTMIAVTGKGNSGEIKGSRIKITDDYVPVGSKSFTISSADKFFVGDRIVVFRPGTDEWIHDIKMDQIEARKGTVQWTAKGYDVQFYRVVTKIEGNKIFIDNPVVMAMEKRYGGGEVYKYNFPGRINNVGIENIYCESQFVNDTDESHGWIAIAFNKIENAWAKNVTSMFFGNSCVSMQSEAKNISVINCSCFEAKSIITGERRYSFSNAGQLNLVMNCQTTEGRHDYVTGAKAGGPNVFYNSTAKKTHADIGPHQRWAMGTLYDNIVTDGAINVQDRGNAGSGHGWAGVNQVVWNCTAKIATVQSPWFSGKNYCIGLQGNKVEGAFKDRPDGEWEGLNKPNLNPKSLYEAQLKARGNALPN